MNCLIMQSFGFCYSLVDLYELPGKLGTQGTTIRCTTYPRRQTTSLTMLRFSARRLGRPTGLGASGSVA